MGIFILPSLSTASSDSLYLNFHTEYLDPVRTTTSTKEEVMTMASI